MDWMLDVGRSSSSSLLSSLILWLMAYGSWLWRETRDRVVVVAVAVQASGAWCGTTVAG
jgi:hypothetical protein